MHIPNISNNVKCNTVILIPIFSPTKLIHISSIFKAKVQKRNVPNLGKFVPVPLFVSAEIVQIPRHMEKCFLPEIYGHNTLFNCNCTTLENAFP